MPNVLGQNFALYHCLGPSIQTALLNAPLVVVVGWGLGKPMDLNFEIFMSVLLILSILVVGNFLRDGKSDYLEGALLVVSLLQILAVFRIGQPAFRNRKERVGLIFAGTDCLCYHRYNDVVLSQSRRNNRSLEG